MDSPVPDSVRESGSTRSDRIFVHRQSDLGDPERTIYRLLIAELYGLA